MVIVGGSIHINSLKQEDLLRLTQFHPNVMKVNQKPSLSVSVRKIRLATFMTFIHIMNHAVDGEYIVVRTLLST